MTLPRFFVPGVRTIGERLPIEGGDAHKIAHVLRLRNDDRIEIVDSSGTLFTATIHLDANTIEAKLVEAIAETNDRTTDTPRIDLAQAIPKGQKMDFIVEKATELGVATIVPFYSERTIVHDLGEAKLERWRRLAKTAAQQCGRRDIPAIEPPHSFEALLNRMQNYDAILFAWELAPHEPLRNRLPNLLAGAQRVLVAIGPEGGFTHDEATAAEAQGANLVWLGRRILRTETAAVALLAVISALTE